ncbi:MAG: hypothetical protein Greene101449_831 [Candidatus Peregrinibacteria bacterium Greene1014_49]|nr:MAG: hypothetical protein Greene101449_831 [Candidatus Peregrinibacteria bacterium Greene1014_49]
MRRSHSIGHTLQSLRNNGGSFGDVQSLFGIDVGEQVQGNPLPSHMMLTHPEEWFEANRKKWEMCFTERRNDQITIGCVDPRVAHAAHLRYAGLGVVDGSLDHAAEKIIRLREGVLQDCAITLLSHDDCAAIHKKVSGHPREGEVDRDAFAAWWGMELAQVINDRSPGIPVKHDHLSQSRMLAQRPIEAIYIDCTDSFTTTSDVPFGHTISLLNPGGITFGIGVRLRNILGNGLGNYLLPQVEFITDRVLETSVQYSREHPLTLVVLRDRQKRFLSNVVQEMANGLVRQHWGKVQVMGVDQEGKIHTLEKYDQNEGNA